MTQIFESELEKFQNQRNSRNMVTKSFWSESLWEAVNSDGGCPSSAVIGSLLSSSEYILWYDKMNDKMKRLRDGYSMNVHHQACARSTRTKNKIQTPPYWSLTSCPPLSAGDLSRGSGDRWPTRSGSWRDGSRQRRLHCSICWSPSGSSAGQLTLQDDQDAQKALEIKTDCSQDAAAISLYRKPQIHPLPYLTNLSARGWQEGWGACK